MDIKGEKGGGEGRKEGCRGKGKRPPMVNISRTIFRPSRERGKRAKEKKKKKGGGQVYKKSRAVSVRKREIFPRRREGGEEIERKKKRPFSAWRGPETYGLLSTTVFFQTMGGRKKGGKRLTKKR